VDEDEIRQGFNAVLIQGDITHEFFISHLRLQHAKRILLLGPDSLRSYEAASTMLNLMPDMGHKIIIHCWSLRFMRAMEAIRVAQAILEELQLRDKVDLNSEDTVVVLGTGYEEANLRTALWIRKKFPRAKVIARSTKESVFATEVGQEHGIISISIAQLVEDNILGDWLEV
jgi:hypothetical protein